MSDEAAYLLQCQEGLGSPSERLVCELICDLTGLQYHKSASRVLRDTAKVPHPGISHGNTARSLNAAGVIRQNLGDDYLMQKACLLRITNMAERVRSMS